MLGKREMTIEFWWRNLKERDHFKDLDMADRITLKQSLKK
jgi:hypothetical protein